MYMFFSCLLALCFTFGFPFIWSKVSPGHAGFNCSSLIYKLCFSVTRKTFLGKCIGISDLHIKAQCSLPSVMQPSLSFLLLQSTNILFVINAQWRLKHELYKADDKVIWLLVIVRVHQLSSLMTMEQIIMFTSNLFVGLPQMQNC